MRYDDEGSPSPSGRYGWSITVADLKRALEGVPDDYEVMLENADVDDISIANVNINTIYPPFDGAPGLLVIGGGQILNFEYGYEERQDIAWGEHGTEEQIKAGAIKRWNTAREPGVWSS